MNNESRIISDGENKQLQLDISTLIEDPKRQKVLTAAALNQVLAVEYAITKMSNKEIEDLLEKITEAEKPQNSTNGHSKTQEIKLYGINERENGSHQVDAGQEDSEESSPDEESQNRLI